MRRFTVLPIALLALACASAPPGKDASPEGPTPDPEDADSADSGDTAAPVVPMEPQGRLRIEEVYYAGAVPQAGIDRYYSDQFIRLRNDSDDTVAAGGLIVGDAHGLAGTINPTDAPDAHADDPAVVVMSNLWRVPGAPEDVLVPPGGCLLIAQDAGQHTPYSEIDLWDADFEAVVAGGHDDDDAVVPNLERVMFTGGYDWLVTVFGPTIVVFAPLDNSALTFGDRTAQAPASAIVDTMEALMNADSGSYKRLHPDIDAGFTHVSDTYTGESVRRRSTADGHLQDTDDSTADFEVAALPEVGCPPL